ncbi:MAG TPA: HD domain-containing protein [Thermoanaerobaculia bacterium]|nr:HD domain-containing protein [Thermoanaerobaculia bacterium]
MLTLRDPVHGFVRADDLEAALLDSRPLQRLRFVHQLGLASMVFPGAEHSRFSHAVGAMELAGRVYDALAAHQPDLLPPELGSRERRLVRLAALTHDLGHAPFSHSAEEHFEDGLDHEAMSRRLLASPELTVCFERHGEGIGPDDVAALLAGGEGAVGRLLARVVSGELDVDKMDYLLRDSLFCGVRYGSYDLDRLLDTVRALRQDEDDDWGIGVEEGGVHAREALVMARYYMFTQGYFNVTGKVLELHLNGWLLDEGRRWPSDPQAFLEEDDVAVLARMRASSSQHAQAVLHRDRFPLAFETREHLAPEERQRFSGLLPELTARFGAHRLLISNSAKDPHRLAKARVLVERYDGTLEPMEEASQFMRHLTRIDTFRVYAAREVRDAVAELLRERWGD